MSRNGPAVVIPEGLHPKLPTTGSKNKPLIPGDRDNPAGAVSRDGQALGAQADASDKAKAAAAAAQLQRMQMQGSK